MPKESESPRRSVANVRAYTARRLNLASSIGGKLKQSFAQVRFFILVIKLNFRGKF